jgi:succinate dehydrogenase assembly factor 2
MRIRERDAELRRRHTVLELNAIVGKGDEGAVNEDEVRRKRLIYRSKQRGWLEVDLLLGSWASAHVPSLKGEQLEQYERILNQETIDIYNIITKQIPPPPGVDSPVLRILQDYASSKPFGANKETYATMKAKANLI